MKFTITTSPLAADATGQFIALRHDKDARRAAAVAVSLTARLAAFTTGDDMLRHAVGQRDPLAWLQSQAKAAQDGLAAVQQERADAAALIATDAVTRRRLDQVAMRQLDFARQEAAGHRAVARAYATAADTLRLQLADAGVMSHEEVESIISARLSGESVPAAVHVARAEDAEARATALDRFLAAPLRNREVLGKALAAELEVLADLAAASAGDVMARIKREGQLSAAQHKLHPPPGRPFARVV